MNAKKLEQELSVATNAYNNALINNNLSMKTYYGNVINRLYHSYKRNV